jgi:malonyl-CoA O-methyltransferase
MDRLAPRPDIKAAVAAAFSAAAETYNDGADVQRNAADGLARRIGTLPLPAKPRILEIGCGTGFLSAHLMRMAGADVLLSDISESMLERCRRSLAPDTSARFLQMDGEEPEAAGTGFDLICSSFAFQWFNDLAGSLDRLAALLAPGGHLMFATLGADSFHEWRQAHAQLNLASAVRNYPTGDALSRMLPKSGVGKIEEEHVVRDYPDGLAFLDHLKKIGAHLPETSHRPLAPGALRRVLRRFEGGISVTYHVAYGLWQRN